MYNDPADSSADGPPTISALRGVPGAWRPPRRRPRGDDRARSTASRRSSRSDDRHRHHRHHRTQHKRNRRDSYSSEESHAAGTDVSDGDARAATASAGNVSSDDDSGSEEEWERARRLRKQRMASKPVVSAADLLAGLEMPDVSPTKAS